MYVIRDNNLRVEMESVLKRHRTVELEYDDMKLRYMSDGGKIKTILMGFVNLANFISYDAGDHYRRSIITFAIPEGIDIIGPLFYECFGGIKKIEGKFIDRVELPDSCEEIWDYAFYGCDNLERITWKNVKKIGYRALLHTLISQNDIPFHIQTESQVCRNNDNGRRPTDDKEYVEYKISGQWVRYSVKDIISKDKEDCSMRARVRMRII